MKRPRLRQIKPLLTPIDTRTVKPFNTRSYKARLQADPSLKFYSSAPWQQFRSTVIAERGRRCEICGTTPNTAYLDHIEELRDGGAPLDRSNVQVLCGSCHQKKSIRARMTRFAMD